MARSDRSTSFNATRAATAVSLTALALFAVTGCSAVEPTPMVTATVTVTPTPAATLTATATPSTTPTDDAAAEAPLIPNPAVPDLTPNAVPEPLPQGPAMDLGSTPGARGTPVANSAGALITYSVVEGDSFFDIAQRFNVPVQLMLTMNPSVPGLGESIYINQTINLDWTATL